MKYQGKIFPVLFILIVNISNAQIVNKIDGYFDSMASSLNDRQRLACNDSIVTGLMSWFINRDNIMSSELDQIKYLGQIISSDSLVKVFSWNIPLSSGDNIYNCIIYNAREDTTVFLKGRKGLPDIETDAILEAGEWYGALYYDIELLCDSENKTYILLGTDPDNIYMNSKVIEILRFDSDGSPLFGGKVFSVRDKVLTRMIFRYSPITNMMLRFDNDRSAIIYDHLSPSSPGFEGQYMYYGPDFSYDAFEIIDRKLVLIQDIDIRDKR